ncbi:MAG: family 43 glycosylhydrolase [Verrucomicrobiota bacterium]|nr:family 43 glycosylhydrolase [Limisphaera sp.]MDW8382453.1 family 43 glycosylhydrolase [Verrucomicrobiota bacterium]
MRLGFGQCQRSNPRAKATGWALSCAVMVLPAVLTSPMCARDLNEPVRETTELTAVSSRDAAWPVRNSTDQAGLQPPPNPVLPGADPHAMVYQGKVWLYPTWSDGPLDRFYAFSSTNLVHWQRHGPVLRLNDVRWVAEDGAPRHYAWAPCVLEYEGRWYFYYSVGPQNPTPSRIGVAVGDRPEGPFQDIGRPLITGGNDFEAIDPMVFVDPLTGQIYLYAGGSAGAKLCVFELGPNPTQILREIPVETPPYFTEGAFLHYWQGRYYLSYSHGSFRHASYSVHYVTAQSPLGPWTYRGAILTSDATRKGPGHHSFIQDPPTGQWWVVYHRWERQSGDGPYRGHRWICMDRVEYDADGLIRPIRMTSGPAISARSGSRGGRSESN